ncbi:12408_t:CDS:2, partial [Funneliformis geosporum]
MTDYFKKQNPSSFSFLNFLCFKLLYENERVSWKSKKEEFELYCRDLKLYLRDQVVIEDLREKWSELIESQVWYLFWDPSTACFARGPEGILEEKDSQEVQTLWKGVMSNTGGITFYYFMDDLKKDLEQNMETVLDEEKEELDNQILLQEVKDRYETLASESIYEIIRRISEKMKSIDLAKLSFNNPLLSFILDLDRIDPIINDLIPKSLLEEASQYENVRNWKGFTTEFIKWIDSLLNGQEPQNLERQQEECEYIKIMYRSLKEVWDRGRYQNKLKDDCSILEDTHIHEIMHNIIYNTIKDSNGKIAIDWTRKTSEEGNEKVDLDYDIWLSQMKATERKIQQTTFRSRNIPDWMAQYRIGDFLYEFLYGEAAGPLYRSTTVRTEGNRRKLIRFMSRS